MTDVLTVEPLEVLYRAPVRILSADGSVAFLLA